MAFGSNNSLPDVDAGNIMAKNNEVYVNEINTTIKFSDKYKLKIDEFHNIFTNQVLVLYPVTPIINNQFTKSLLSQLKSIVTTAENHLSLLRLQLFNLHMI